MDKLEKTILSKAAGEHRFDPEQQKQFLGTFRERVVLAVRPSQLKPELMEEFPRLFTDYQVEFRDLNMKISAELSPSLQMTLMKIAQQHHFPATIVQEKDGSSPYAFVLHGNQAMDIEDIEPALLFPKESQKVEKPSFWSKIWRKS